MEGQTRTVSRAEDFWASLDVAGAPEDVIAMGDDLAPATLLAAYRHGCFPWPAEGWPAVPWCSPDPRGVLPLAGLHVSRSLRATLRRCGWTATLDAAFDDIVAGCADRPATWITAAMRAAYADLHRAGHAHSVEVWSARGRLVGGVYGVLTGGIFSGESMFSLEAAASKVALVDLVDRLSRGGGVLLDCQQPTGHLLTLGAVGMTRSDYLGLLRKVRDRPVTLDCTPRPVAELKPGTARGAGDARS